MKIVIIIVVAIISVAVYIMKNRQPRVTVRPVSGNASPPADFPPKPKWKPNIPVDVERITKAFRYYTDNKLTFAVFKNGTCVPVKPESTQPEQDAVTVLDGLFRQHPDFNPLTMDDGNWMITHSDAAYSICFADEVESNWDAIDKNHLDAIARDEVLLDAKLQPVVFDKKGKIGLFGRARWFMDCEEPKIVRIVRPDSQPTNAPYSQPASQVEKR